MYVAGQWGSNIASGSTGEMTSEVSASRITLDEQVILRISVVYPYSNSEKSPRLVPMEDFSVTKKSLFSVSPGYPEFYIKTLVDNKNPYVGEQIIYTFQVHGRTKRTQTLHTLPPIAGFKSLDIPYVARNKYRRKPGTAFYGREIKIALFPTKPGDLTIGQSKIDRV